MARIVDEYMKNRKRRPEGAVNGSLKFLAKYLAAVPKSPPNTIKFLKEKYPSQLVTRVPKSIPWNGRKLMQQTEHESELK
jgi:hypothetical protein